MFKRIVTKRLIFAILSCVMTMFISTSVFAHHMFYDQVAGAPVPLQWINLSVDGHMLKLLANADYLGEPYTNNYSTAVTRWNDSSSPVIVYEETFSNSNCDIGTPTQQWWDNKGIPYFAAAATIVYDTDDSEIMTVEDAQASTGEIDYANIWTNPDPDWAGETELDQTKTLVHEMGHVMCLGHPDRAYYDPISPTTKSVMRQGSLGYDTPQYHEESDIRDMYDF